MSDLHVQPAADGTPGLSQLQRVSNAFSAPSKTFEDIKRGNASWWMPFLLFVLIGTALWAAVNAKVDWVQVAENGVKMSPKAADALDKLSPEQRENQIRVSSNIQKAIWGAAPVGVLLLDLIAAGVLVASINFGFGGKATFGKTLAVVWYAGLPGLVKLVLGAVGLFAGVAPDAFLPSNPAGTNLGYYLNPTDTNRILYSLAIAVDPITIWSLVLTAIGISIVAGTKRSAGYTIVFGWWVLMLIVGVGFTAAFQ